jgi:hypothetical protein
MPACHVKYPLKAWFSDSLYILRAVHVKKRHPRRLIVHFDTAQCPEFIEGAALNAAGGRDAVF